jgi:HSP20 family protein
VLTGEELVVVMELAGVGRDDVRLATGEDELVVQGRRREPVELSKERYLALEISHGDFERRVPLPAGLRLDGVSASYRDGFLVIRIPRAEAGVAWREEQR